MKYYRYLYASNPIDLTESIDKFTEDELSKGEKFSLFDIVYNPAASQTDYAFVAVLYKKYSNRLVRT